MMNMGCGMLAEGAQNTFANPETAPESSGFFAPVS